MNLLDKIYIIQLENKFTYFKKKSIYFICIVFKNTNLKNTW